MTDYRAILQELARRIDENPSQRLPIIQQFYAEMVESGDRDGADHLMTLRAIIMAEDRASETAQKLLISIHGIRTRGEWQKVLTPELNQAGFIHVPLDYGFFRAIQLIIPLLRNKQVKWFRDEYTQIKDRYPHLTASIIAHSFGTYLAAKAMELYEEIKFDQIIFCGSIVPQGYNWQDRIDRNQATRVLNECGRKDYVVRIAAFAISDAGPSGAFGFKENIKDFLYQRHNNGFGHSDYMYRLNYKNNWIPFLKNIRTPENHPNNASPKNWKFYSTITTLILFLVIIIWVLLLRTS